MQGPLKRAAVLWIGLATIMGGCRTTSSASSSQVKVDIPTGPSDTDQVSAFVARMRGFQQAGTGQIAGADIFGFFPLSSDEQATLAGARAQDAQVTCDSDTCTITEDGDPLTLTLSQVKIPGLGNPSMQLDGTVTIKLRVLGDADLELCRVDGILVRKFLWVSFSGAHVTPDATTLDIGPGGSYPNC